MIKNKMSKIISINKETISKDFLYPVLFFLCLVLIVSPISSVLGIFSEGVKPAMANKLIYVIFYYPLYIKYLLYIHKNIQKFVFFRFILYPLTILNILLGLMLAVIVFNGALIWFFVFLFQIVFFVIILSGIMGLIQDIKTLKNTVLPNDDNI